jgi:hypothetical protein
MNAPEHAPDAGRTPRTCGSCGTEDLTRLPMVLTDGTEVTFISCNACETREWLVPLADGTWRAAPIDVVLSRSARRA